MIKGPLTLTLAAVLAVGSAGAAIAQDYPQNTPQYDPAYEQAQADYQAQRETYEQQRAAYEDARAAYERAKADYDARWGYGAYERRYGDFTTYYYSTSPSYRGVTRDDGYYYTAPTTFRGYEVYRNSPCEQRRSENSAAGTVIGALAGAAIGSNLAAHSGGRLGGAVLGAVAGGAIGNNVGRSTAHCDDNGYYYTYEQTYPYADDGTYAGRYDSDYYRSRGCRLALAPTDFDGVTDWRYVRTCPDADGYYRFTN